MELDDFKNTWDEMGNQAKQKQNLDLKIFDKMSNKRIHSKLYKIIFPEILGSVVCIGSIIFIAFNFGKLENNTYQIIGVLGILLLAILTTISLLSIQNLYKSEDVNKTYADTLRSFSVQKIKFCKLQKLNLRLSYLLMVIVILLLPKFFEKNGITDSKYFFVFSFSFGFSFFLIFSEWAIKSYKKTIRQTEDFLKELSA
jgi:hypothetical protein